MKSKYFFVYTIMFCISILFLFLGTSYYSTYKEDKELSKLRRDQQEVILDSIESYLKNHVIVYTGKSSYSKTGEVEFLFFGNKLKNFTLYNKGEALSEDYVQVKKELELVAEEYEYISKYYLNSKLYDYSVDSIMVWYEDGSMNTFNKKITSAPFGWYTIMVKDLFVNKEDYFKMTCKLESELNPPLLAKSKSYFFLFTIFSLIGTFLVFLDESYRKKEILKKIKIRSQYIENLTKTYEMTKIPVLINNISIRCFQNQTRQLLTGALTYAQPKEYFLFISFTNLIDKPISAIEFEIKTQNAFGEDLSYFTVSKKGLFIFGDLVQCEWNLINNLDINNTIAEVKRIMFNDGTIWKK